MPTIKSVSWFLCCSAGQAAAFPVIPLGASHQVGLGPEFGSFRHATRIWLSTLYFDLFANLPTVIVSNMWPFQAKQRVFNFLICTAYSCLYHSTPRQLLKQLLDGIPGYHASQVLLARYMPGGLQFQRLGFSSRLKSPCQQRWRQQVCWSKPMAWITHATATGLPHGFLRLFLANIQTSLISCQFLKTSPT